MTSPQNPWQSPGGPQPQYGPPPGGFPSGQPMPSGPNMPGAPQQGGYPGYPYGAPAAPQLNSSPLQPPATVTAAFWISIIAPLVATVLAVVNFLLYQGFMDDVINASIADSGLDAGAEDALKIAHGFFIGVAIFLTVIFVIVTGLWILFGFKMRAGRNWARVMLTIFGGLWLLYAIGSLASGGLSMGSELPPGVEEPTGITVLAYVDGGFGLVAMIAFLVLVYLKPSNSYFRAAGHR